MLDVPYRSQLDGARYALANCGPASLGMVLAYFGVDASLWDVRVRAMQAQGSWEDYSDSYGVFVHGLAATAESYGLRSEGLWNREAGHVDRLHEWQAADLRRVLRLDAVGLEGQVREMITALALAPAAEAAAGHGIQDGTHRRDTDPQTRVAARALAARLDQQRVTHLERQVVSFRMVAGTRSPGNRSSSAETGTG